MMAWGSRTSMARAGAPSSTAPAASTIRLPNRLIAAAAPASAATVPSSSDPVISPAPELPTPAAAASIGITDSSRKKLLSTQNSDRNTSASGPLMIRPPGLPPPLPGPVSAWGTALMSATVEPKWSTDKVQFHGD